jgi:hypothetical protein
MPRLSECTDRLLVEYGMVSLQELSSQGPVMGGPEWQWCFGDGHEYSIRLTEDEDAGPLDGGEQYEMCARCNHVRLAPYLIINGVEVSRRPQCAPADPMAVAWASPRRLQIEGPQ